MKRLLLWVSACALVSLAGGAEETFSRTLPPDDYAAAGLGKLTEAERARLDALVRDYKSGALEAAKREAAAAAKAAMAKKPEPGPSLLERAKVLLTPGTKIEYSTLDSRIAGEFRGWDRKTVFKLENGQRWQVTDTEPYITPPVQSPAVKIAPGALGAFWMTIEGVRPRVKVQSLDAK